MKFMASIDDSIDGLIEFLSTGDNLIWVSAFLGFVVLYIVGCGLIAAHWGDDHG